MMKELTGNIVQMLVRAAQDQLLVDQKRSSCQLLDQQGLMD
jgi:hypothetical protein